MKSNIAAARVVTANDDERPRQVAVKSIGALFCNGRSLSEVATMKERNGTLSL